MVIREWLRRMTGKPTTKAEIGTKQRLYASDHLLSHSVTELQLYREELRRYDLEYQHRKVTEARID
jgi:hypothetical protein